MIARNDSSMCNIDVTDNLCKQNTPVCRMLSTPVPNHNRVAPIGNKQCMNFINYVESANETAAFCDKIIAIDFTFNLA